MLFSTFYLNVDTTNEKTLTYLALVTNKFSDRTVYSWHGAQQIFDKTNVSMTYLHKKKADQRILD